MPQTAEDVQIAIDFPTKDERISSPDYTVRISASETGRVEISIDGQPFEPCRHAAGHWWFDWTGYNPGTHRTVVRLTSYEGRPLAELHSRFRVEPEGAQPQTPAPATEAEPRAKKRRR